MVSRKQGHIDHFVFFLNAQRPTFYLEFGSAIVRFVFFRVTCRYQRSSRDFAVERWAQCIFGRSRELVRNAG